MTHSRVRWTLLLALVAVAVIAGAHSAGAQSRFDIGATIGAGSFRSHSTERGVVLGASVGLRLSPSLTLAPQVSYWSDSHDSFLAIGPELRWTPNDMRRTSVLVGVGIGSESMDYLSNGEAPGGGGTEYLKSVMMTLGAEYMLLRNSPVQPLLQARMAMGLVTLEDENSGAYDRGLLFTVGIGLRLGRK